MTASPAAVCRGLVHLYRVEGEDVAALRGVDLVVEPGQRVALLGPSGSGKSTLFAILGGIMRPSAGRAEAFGVDLLRARPGDLRRLRRDRLGLMLQGAGRNLKRQDDALGNVRSAVRGGGRRDEGPGRRVLQAGGVAPRGGPVGDLPPAEQQVVALAVAMATRPGLLLADEPTSRLAPEARDRLLDLIVASAEEQGSAVLVVTHDPVVAQRMQRMIHLRDGRIAEEAGRDGRFSVIGADGAVALPEGAASVGWRPGVLVSIEYDADEVRMRRSRP